MKSHTKQKSVNIYGATGVVGGKALEIIKHFPHLFRINVLATWSNAQSLARLARDFKAQRVVLADESGATTLKIMLEGTTISWDVGMEAYREATHEPVDYFIAAMGGLGGLDALMEAIPNTQHLLIANKEALVVAGDLVIEKARKHGCRVILLDSEHYAAWFLAGCGERKIKSLTLTASGGPFLRYGAQSMSKITVQEALAHPVWKMGAKISIDSATLVNKVLELLEAKTFFSLQENALSVIIHPQCLVHAFVEDQKGIVHSLMSSPEMLFSVGGGLFYPDHAPPIAPHVDVETLATLHFEDVDEHRFPALSLGRSLLKEDWRYSVVFNAANDVCVEAFLKDNLSFSSIVATVERVIFGMCATLPVEDFSLGSLKSLDTRTRTMTQTLINKHQTHHNPGSLGS